MPSSGMLHPMALVSTDVSEERSASIIRVTRFGELGATLVLTSNILDAVLRSYAICSVCKSSAVRACMPYVSSL
jgi:hypothetical protein